MIDLDQIEKLASDATPGPWRWGGHNESYGGVHLQSLVSGHPCVMTFQRRGMRSAEPVFWKRTDKSDPGWSPAKMQPARDIALLEVPYRSDVVALDNVDARFIADVSPDVVLALIARIRELEEKIDDWRHDALERSERDY